MEGEHLVKAFLMIGFLFGHCCSSHSLEFVSRRCRLLLIGVNVGNSLSNLRRCNELRNVVVFWELFLHGETTLNRSF